MHESCGICLQDITEGEPITYLHMHSAHGFHAFHKDCATPWVGLRRCLALVQPMSTTLLLSGTSAVRI